MSIDPDRCPAVGRLHPAADGPLARVRLPGGRLGAAQARAIAALASELGSGEVTLTGRGNLQIRGLTGPDAEQRLTDGLTAAGLLPTPSHDHARNIAASPPIGANASAVTELLALLDVRLRERTQLAELSGRFWFGIDDGTGDIAALRPDVAVLAQPVSSAGSTPSLLWSILVGAHRIDGEHDSDDAVELALAAAAAVAAGSTWRIDDGAAIAAQLGHRIAGLHSPAAPARRDIGWIEQPDGRITLGAGVALGRIDADLLALLGAIERPLTITPWRSILIHDLTEDEADPVLRVLAPRGLIFDINHPLIEISACVGAPFCASAAGDTRSAAIDLALARTGQSVPGKAAAVDDGGFGPVHLVGCSRGCGAPPTEHRLIVID